MKKYRVIARAEIIDLIARNLHTDEGLKALDGYREFIVEAENLDDTNAFNAAFNRFEKKTCKSNWNYSIDKELTD